MKTSIDRRLFLGRGLQGLAGLTVGANLAYSRPLGEEEDENAFVFSRFKFLGKTSAKDEWDICPEGDNNLIDYMRRFTNLKFSQKKWDDRVVAVDDFAKMYTQPFLFMTGEVDFSFTPREAATLGEYFKRGGFLYADDCVGQYAPEPLWFYEAMLREIRRVLPGHSFEVLPYDHALYHCFHDIKSGSSWYVRDRPRKAIYPDRGVFYKKRLVAFLTGSDQHCAWARRGARDHYYPDAIRLGTNIVIYALTH